MYSIISSPCQRSRRCALFAVPPRLRASVASVGTGGRQATLLIFFLDTHKICWLGDFIPFLVGQQNYFIRKLRDNLRAKGNPVRRVAGVSERRLAGGVLCWGRAWRRPSHCVARQSFHCHSVIADGVDTRCRIYFVLSFALMWGVLRGVEGGSPSHLRSCLISVVCHGARTCLVSTVCPGRRVACHPPGNFMNRTAWNVCSEHLFSSCWEDPNCFRGVNMISTCQARITFDTFSE